MSNKIDNFKPPLKTNLNLHLNNQKFHKKCFRKVEKKKGTFDRVIGIINLYLKHKKYNEPSILSELIFTET